MTDSAAIAPSPPATPTGDARFELLVRSVRDYAIFMLDPQGRVMTWNAGAENLKGWRAQEIIGRPFETFYTEEAVAAGTPANGLRLAAQHGRFESRGWRVRKDGTHFWADVVITALRDEQGRLVGFGKVTRDLTESRRQQEVLRQSEEQFRLLVESVKDYALFMLDPAGIVQTWNAGAAAIHGYAAAQAIGRHFSMFFTDEDRAAGRPAAELEKARRDGRAQVEALRVRRDGSLFWADVKLTSVHDAGGRLLGFAKITRDLTEQRRIADIEGASRRMTSFLAMLAHELRNPLAPIRNAAAILQMQPDLAPVLQRARDILDRQGRHLTRLVDDLLDVGRIATGKIVLQREALDFRDVVHASAETFAVAAAAKSIALRVDVPARPLPMTGDFTRLTQALQNVIGNAVRYTPAGGRIDVAVSTEHASVVTCVGDTGVGIAPAALERIFELFVQEETSRLPNDSGLGIGLSLARALVSQHGGLVTARSEGLGRGSTFVIRLPLGAPQAPVADVPAPDVAPPRRRVLVVDDNRDAADSMTDMLRLMGHDARVAYDGLQARDLAAGWPPEWTLIDINMPRMDGYTLLRALRALPGMQALRAAAVTGYGQPTDRERTLSAGFDVHLTKPVELGQLQRLLEQPTA